eukprot:353183-Chlamydomonas_euryale.AAC.15
MAFAHQFTRTHYATKTFPGARLQLPPSFLNQQCFCHASPLHGRSYCVQLPGGMDQLYAELGSGVNSAAALAFLANAVKDKGAVMPAVALFAKVRRKGGEE